MEMDVNSGSEAVVAPSGAGASAAGASMAGACVAAGAPQAEINMPSSKSAMKDFRDIKQSFRGIIACQI
jgi:hypothetical protein